MLDAILDFFTALRVRVRGESMAPSFRAGDRLVFSRRACRTAPLARFDVVLLRDSPGRAVQPIKRVVGLPGEHVRIEAGRLFIDGRPVDELHLPPQGWQGREPSQEWRLGADQYVVLGDNRAASTDSRAYGPVHRSAIIGRLVRRF